MFPFLANIQEKDPNQGEVGSAEMQGESMADLPEIVRKYFLKFSQHFSFGFQKAKDFYIIL